jgi:serine/threonine protein kinase
VAQRTHPETTPHEHHSADRHEQLTCALVSIMPHHPPSHDIENQPPALRTSSLLKKAPAAPAGLILTATSGVPSTPLARRTALGTLNILGQSNVSATPLSNKRPLTSLFAGVKKLGLGKAVRVVPEQQHAQELEEDDTNMPGTPSAPPQQQQQQQQQQQVQPQSSPNVIVTTPAPTKRVKASPPTPISLVLNEPTPAPVAAAPIPAPLPAVSASAAPPLLSMPPSTPAPASLLAAPSSMPLLQIVAPTPAPVLAIPSHVSPPARIPTPVATPLVASHPPPATVSPPSLAQVAPAPIVASTTASQHIPSRSSPAPAPEVCPIIRSDAPVRQDKGDSRFLLNKVLYTKLGTIGKGGSSLVYKVIDGKGRIYALKEMNIASNQSAQQANVHTPDYISEVNTLYRMRDSAYAIRLDVAQEDTHNHFFYMLMECGSCDLDRHLQTVRTQLSMTPDAPLLPSATVRYFFAAMLRCVNAIHSVTPPILHTDLKPVNFVFSAEAGTLKLIDFGIAKTAQEGSEQTGVIFSNPCGTLNFMSPESVTNGGELHRSSDIWSLGCILYSWIYGEPPFGRFTNQSMKLYAIQNKEDPAQNEPVYFHREIKVVEKVAPRETEGKALKGNGLVVQMDHKGCQITRTYPSMPPHLVGVDLPRETMRPVDPRAIDALRRCLQRNPKERATAEQLLQHKYLFDAPSIEVAKMTYEFHDQIDQMKAEHRSEVERLKARLRQYESEDA